MNLTHNVPQFDVDTLNATSRIQVECSSHKRQSPINLLHIVIVATEQVTMPNYVSIPRDGRMCPIFTPTVNFDFNTDNDEGSDYDPFAKYYDIGDPLIECRYCRAIMWYQERVNKNQHAANPKFSLYYGNGKVELPLLKQPPELLSRLLFDEDSIASRKFQQQIRMYNMMFAFTSPNAKLDNSVNKGGGPPTL
ncbi:hypothetical protein KIW84_040260 [Lathyrus oleraceus]|uniref:Uncharacterized protein n=1 Tax=Pisum sativum TaxID=3888 RepID=A0A9D4X714_PEA|nr:hypothetical protein KIW84_040260 [Pisum sativum]